MILSFRALKSLSGVVSTLLPLVPSNQIRSYLFLLGPEKFIKTTKPSLLLVAQACPSFLLRLLLLLFMRVSSSPPSLSSVPVGSIKAIPAAAAPFWGSLQYRRDRLAYRDAELAKLDEKYIQQEELTPML